MNNEERPLVEIKRTSSESELINEVLSLLCEHMDQFVPIIERFSVTGLTEHALKMFTTLIKDMTSEIVSGIQHKRITSEKLSKVQTDIKVKKN